MKVRRMVTIAMCAAMLTSLSGCASTKTHESTGEYVDDSGITSKVKTAILKEPGLKSTDISVETYRGVVQLSGFVDSQDSVQKAGQVASGVSGVKSVINNLAVKPQK